MSEAARIDKPEFGGIYSVVFRGMACEFSATATFKDGEWENDSVMEITHWCDLPNIKEIKESSSKRLIPPLQGQSKRVLNESDSSEPLTELKKEPCENCDGTGYVIRREDFCTCDPEFGECTNSFPCEDCNEPPT